jgi:phage protein D/phage baseplate assembly protein gpV
VKALLSIPRLTLSLAGKDLPALHMQQLENLVVRHRLSQSSLCELTFRDPRGDLAASNLCIPGMPLSLEANGFAQTLFKGEITAVEHVYEPDSGQVVRVRAYDLLQRLRKRQPVRIHVDVKLPDLAAEMVKELGLSVEAAHTGPVFRRVIQHCQSDLELLTEMARSAGLYLTLQDGVVYIVTMEGRGAPIRLALGSTLLEAHVEMNADGVCREVRADGWDPSVAEWSRGTASRPRSARSIEARMQPADTGGTGEVTIGNLSMDTRMLESRAQSELDRRAAAEVTLWGVAQGNPDLVPGKPVEVEGLTAAFCGTYVVTQVTHTITRTAGFVSEFSTVPPHFTPPARLIGHVVGVVTRIDDPEGLGRVRAKLPAIGDLETEWMCVLTPGGGHDKGLVAIPDVGDQVLIATAAGDPALGVVLGAICGSKGLADTGIHDTSVVRYLFQTPGGQRIRLDDQRKQVRVENSDGSFIEMTPDHVKLHCNTDLTIEAPGRNLVLQAQKIDFRRA